MHITWCKFPKFVPSFSTN